MNKPISIVMVIGSIFYLIAFAHAQQPPTHGELKAYINISDKPDSYKQWLATAPDKRTPVKNIRVFAKSQMAYATFGASGFQLRNDGSAGLSLDIFFIGPDGKQVFAENNYAEYRAKMPGSRFTMIFDSAMDIGFDEEDPVGTYCLKIIVKDAVSNTTASTTSKITCVESESIRDFLSKPVTDAKYLDELWKYYFKTQDPYIIERFIDILHWTEDGHGEEIALGGAAHWSLAFNALQYPQVLSVCKDESTVRDNTTRTILQKIITRVRLSDDLIGLKTKAQPSF